MKKRRIKGILLALTSVAGAFSVHYFFLEKSPETRVDELVQLNTTNTAADASNSFDAPENRLMLSQRAERLEIDITNWNKVVEEKHSMQYLLPTGMEIVDTLEQQQVMEYLFRLPFSVDGPFYVFQGQFIPTDFFGEMAVPDHVFRGGGYMGIVSDPKVSLNDMLVTEIDVGNLNRRVVETYGKKVYFTYYDSPASRQPVYEAVREIRAGLYVYVRYTGMVKRAAALSDFVEYDEILARRVVGEMLASFTE